MSTRRTTRATSTSDVGGPASSVANSQLRSTTSKVTPAKRATRGSRSNVSTAKPEPKKQKLPKVGTKGNSAYGTNSEVNPTQIEGLEGQESQDKIMGDLLNIGQNLPQLPEEDEDEDDGDYSRVGSLPSIARGRGTRQRMLNTPTPGRANETYQFESDINIGANLDSSSVDDLALERSISAYETRKTTLRKSVAKASATLEEDSQEEEEDFEIETRIEIPQDVDTLEAVAPSLWNVAQNSFHRTWQLIVDAGTRVCKKTARFVGTNPGIFWLCLLAIILGGLFTGRGYEIYGQRLLHGNWLPTFSGSSQLGGSDIARIYQQEVRQLKQEIEKLKPQKRLNPATIEKLEEILPDLVLCKKDEQDKLQIPDDFWRALQDKIRNDDTLFESDTGSQDTSKSSLSKKEVHRIAQSVAETVVKKSDKVWDKFLDNNRERITQWQQAAIFTKDGKAYNSDVLDRLEFIGKIKENWESNEEAHRTLQKQVDFISDQVIVTVDRRLNKVEHDLVTIDQLNAAVSHQIRRMIAATELDTLSKANNKQISDRGLDRVNFFSKGTGARIIPYLTAPNFVFPSMNIHWLKKQALKWTLGPVAKPTPPEAALEKWEEHGDCWCAPSKNDAGLNEGFGPTLGVALGREITPDQVIVEHITPGASLEPGAAPREMELFAEILDPIAFKEANHKSSRFFRDHFDNIPFYKAPKNFVLLGIWTYDANLLQSAQSFPLQVDLSTMKDAYTNKIIVHARSNWGGKGVPYTCMYRIRLMGELRK